MDFPRLSTTEYLILDQLRSGSERYGLEMVRASDGQLKRGTVYVTLSRMEDKGFVKSQQRHDPKLAGIPRRVYSISGLGSQTLHAYELAISAMTQSRGISHA